MNDISTPKEISVSLKRSMRTVSDEADVEMTYRAANGRMFEVRVLSKNCYFLYEMRPSGKFMEFDDQGQALGSVPSRTLRRLMKDPNSFWSLVREEDIEDRHLCMVGSGMDVGGRFYSSVAATAKGVWTALEANQWLDNVDRVMLASIEFLAEQKRLGDEAQRQLISESLQSGAAANEAEPDLFDGMRSEYGPLTDMSKQAILDYLNNPNEETWRNTYYVAILPTTSVWKAWRDVDPMAPKEVSMKPWTRLPEPELLRQAMRKAVADSTAEFEADDENDAEPASPTVLL